jgi:hypothetical protein
MLIAYYISKGIKDLEKPLQLLCIVYECIHHFKALRNYQQELILHIELDADQNTLGHKAAFIGNSALFKVL